MPSTLKSVNELTKEEARKHRPVYKPELHEYWCNECDKSHFDAHRFNNPNRSSFNEDDLIEICRPKTCAEPPTQSGYYFVKIAVSNGVEAMWDERWEIGHYELEEGDLSLTGSDSYFSFGLQEHNFIITKIRGPIEMPED